MFQFQIVYITGDTYVVPNAWRFIMHLYHYFNFRSCFCKVWNSIFFRILIFL